MKINTMELKNELRKLKDLEKEYKENIDGFKSSLNDISFFWTDQSALNYQSINNQFAGKMQINLEELMTVSNIYEYISNEYEMIGNNIEYYLAQEQSIYNLIRSYQDSLNHALSLFDGINRNTCTEINQTIDNERNRIKKVIERLNSSELRIKDFFNKMKDIDFNVNQRISKINLTIMQ